MSKTKADVMKTLEGSENGSELLQAFEDTIVHERNVAKGMLETEKKKFEPLSEGFKSLGFDPEKGDHDSFIKKIKDNLEAGKSSKEKLGPAEERMRTLENQMGELSGKLTTSEKKRVSAENTVINGKIRTALFSALNGKIYSANVHADAILGSGKATLSDDGQTVQWKDGDTISELSVGIDGYLERNKDSVINGQGAGAGGGDSGGDKSGGKKTMKRDAYEKLSQPDQMAYTQNGGTLFD